jgi:drug/metabolite transporter (DMT)-like permease
MKNLSAVWLMVLASFLFATMSVCVKLASAHYNAAEIVFYRGLVGLVVMFLMSRIQRCSLRTTHPGAHAWRSLCGVSALSLWFYAIGQLPLATAVTLNYTASVWMALFLMGSALVMGTTRVDARLVATITVGFIGVALILQPTLTQNQLWAGMVGLLSGMLSAMAYLQIATLGRLGEPEVRVVFYFSLGSVVVGGISTVVLGASEHSIRGMLLLMGVGLLATAAQWALTRAYASGSRLVNASLQYLGIAYSFVYGVIIFDDPITLLAMVGMLLVVGAGVLASQLKPLPAKADEAKPATEGNPQP